MSTTEQLTILGPCAVESRDQTRTTVREALALGCTTTRLNLWKPRTSPGFEGVGMMGIPWLQEASEQGVRIAMEVLLPEHVDVLAKSLLRHNPHATLLLWIGARNQNHLVQRDIGSAVAGEERIKLMIKNPIWKSKDHWKGIIEHVKHGGARDEQLLLCHRGHAPSEPNKLRNIPDWQMALEMKDETHLPMLVDPSHIGGQQDLVAQIAMEAAQLPFDGQLIEVHPDPAHALTDSRQQLDWDQMNELMPLLTARSKRT